MCRVVSILQDDELVIVARLLPTKVVGGSSCVGYHEWIVPMPNATHDGMIHRRLLKSSIPTQIVVPMLTHRL